MTGHSRRLAACFPSLFIMFLLWTRYSRWKSPSRIQVASKKSTFARCSAAISSAKKLCKGKEEIYIFLVFFSKSDTERKRVLMKQQGRYTDSQHHCRRSRRRQLSGDWPRVVQPAHQRAGRDPHQIRRWWKSQSQVRCFWRPHLWLSFSFMDRHR